jgi:cytochrome c peroxidase
MEQQMSISSPGFKVLVLAAFGTLLAACGGEASSDAAATVGSERSALTVQERLAACAQDPRVQAGLVSTRICVGADIFFNEAFDGNGRTCGTCHPAANNTTIDVPFITALRQSNPLDPLFVFEQDPNLANLENPNAFTLFAAILENVDGFEDPVNKFVVRSVPHVLSLSTTITADTGDQTTIPPVQRTGWGGDGAPGDGSLRSFLDGAITQHYTKTLARQVGADFRLATPQELDFTADFQLALGRRNELDLTQVNIFDPVANQGRQAFIDPARGRCNVCHLNAGANFQDTGKNRNFDTRTRIAVAGAVGTLPDGGPIFDGGFGGVGLAQPNFDALEIGFLNSFGTGEFNTPTLIEAADTPPFFHNNQFALEIEDAVFFYLGPFAGSPAADELEARFGTPLNFSTEDGFAIARFLRVLNVAFNLDIARQRLNAAMTLVTRFRDTRADVQKRLMELAENEIDDALEVLTSVRTTQPFLPVAVDRLGLAKAEIAAGLSPTATWQQRQNRISNAISRVLNARDHTGANINFQLGQGNLMF